jgi:hypothetical protein
MREKGFAHLILIFILVVGLLAGGYLYEKGYLKFEMNPNNNSQYVSPTTIPVETITPSIAQVVDITNTTKPTQTVKVIIPNTWGQQTAEDTYLGIKTTVSLPSNWTFSFTGSETSLSGPNDETWEYETSIITDKNGAVKNMYTGGSRREWYQKYLNGDFQNKYDSPPQIGQIIEHTIGNTSYLEITISGGYLSENRKIYLYLENNIIHMFSPVSQKALSSNTQLGSIVDKVFYSLKSEVKK